MGRMVIKKKKLKTKNKKIFTFKKNKKISSPLPVLAESLLIKPPKGLMISPREKNDWEAWQTFNAGVILLKNKVHFLYRALGPGWISRIGYAVSNDGFKINQRLPYPVYEHPLVDDPSFATYSLASGGGLGGCEDPRLIRINKEDRLYMIYTACDQGLRVGLTSIKIEDFLNKKWCWRRPVLISPPNQVHKNWVIFPEKIKGRYAILHSINPVTIAYFDSLEFDNKTYINSFYNPEPKADHWYWESWVKGVGPPPIKTKKGWLVFYHAVDKNDFGKYKVGAMLLDLEEPTKVLSRFKKPILEPSETYEYNGFKPGVIYVTGAIVRDNNLLIYYGGADNYVCVAYCNFEKFLMALEKETKPKLKQKILKKQRTSKI